MDEIFTSYGVPHTVVSDNGTNFSSVEFRNFLKISGVTYHKQTAPYHPATNGQAERSVQTIKNALKAMGSTRSNIQSNLNQFLRQYRNAPHTTTGKPPSMLFLGRLLRSRLHLVRPENINHEISERQYVEFTPKYRTFEINRKVYFLSGNPRMDKWLPGVIRARLGDLHYQIEFRGKIVKRHVDQIRSSSEDTRSTECYQSRRQTTTTMSPYMAIEPSGSQPNVNESITEANTSNDVESCTADQNIEAEQNEELLETEHIVLPAPGLATPSGCESNRSINDPIGAPRRSARQRRPRVLFSP